MVKEKGALYSRKLRGKLREGEGERLAEVIKEVNSTRQRLKRAHFGQRLNEVMGELRATWGVLGEVLAGVRRGGLGLPVATLKRMGLG